MAVEIIANKVGLTELTLGMTAVPRIKLGSGT
jgi:hypothetical protein